jgi:uncharacterized protein (TIGR03084 family)
MPAELTMLAELRDDLAAEHADLDSVVAPLPASSWDTPTPSEPWTVRDQIAHIAFFDAEARLAATQPHAFSEHLAGAVGDPDGYMAASLDAGRRLNPAELLADWRSGRQAMLAAFAGLDPAGRIPWFGPPMSPASFITARLMETWCHGQDVADALGIVRRPTARLRHVARLGMRTRAYSYTIRNREAPSGDVFVDLAGPGGETWRWGDPAASASVRGPALDFCLVVTQRRHIDDTDLRVEGSPAREWMEIAQAFAGPPGPGRRPGQFARPGAIRAG